MLCPLSPWMTGQLHPLAGVTSSCCSGGCLGGSCSRLCTRHPQLVEAATGGAESCWHPVYAAGWHWRAAACSRQQGRLAGTAGCRGGCRLTDLVTMMCLQPMSSPPWDLDRTTLCRGADGDPSVRWRAPAGHGSGRWRGALLAVGDAPVDATAAPRLGSCEATGRAGGLVNPGLPQAGARLPARRLSGAEEAQGRRKGSRGRARDNAAGRLYLTSSCPVPFLLRSPLQPQHPLLSALRCDRS